MATRRDAREIAIHILFIMDICDLTKNEAWASYFRINNKNDLQNIMEFLHELVDGTVFNLEVIDTEISNVLDNWSLDRVAAVDRAILRLASFELLFLFSVPTNVAINEAIDLAKDFSTDESGKFVNGVLDKIKNKRGVYERANSF